MGYSILELVLRRLREEGYQASAAYPGQVFPQIEETVVAVHIEKVDRANMIVTIEVSVITPASLGGTACEVEALRVAEILGWSGADCVQNGCTYDGVAQVYLVSILATYIGTTESDRCVIWPGFYCYVGGNFHPYVIAVTTEEVWTTEALEVMGENVPDQILGIRRMWKIQVEELLPADSTESAEPEGEFEIRVISDNKTEVYSGCRWTSVKRHRSKEGLRRTRSGYALAYEET